MNSTQPAPAPRRTRRDCQRDSKPRTLAMRNARAAKLAARTAVRDNLAALAAEYGVPFTTTTA